MARLTATLLLSDHDLCDDAEDFALGCLDVVQTQRHTRSATWLDEPLIPADLMLNFLSAPRVPQAELDKFGKAINFHPAPPEYPGVGSASIALYDHRPTHGVTAHLMTDRFDDGQVLMVRRFPIDRSWGYKTLWERSLQENLALFKEVVGRLVTGASFNTNLADGWKRKAITRAQFEKHRAFTEVPA